MEKPWPMHAAGPREGVPSSRTEGKAAQHPSRSIFLSNVFCHVLRRNMHRTCITAYRCHIALTPVAAGKRFFLACCGKPLPMLPTAKITVYSSRGSYPLGHTSSCQGVCVTCRRAFLMALTIGPQDHFQPAG